MFSMKDWLGGLFIGVVLTLFVIFNPFDAKAAFMAGYNKVRNWAYHYQPCPEHTVCTPQVTPTPNGQ